MAKFIPGEYVKVINSQSKYFEQAGCINNDYRSGSEPQSYGILFDDGHTYWIRETDLVRAKNPSRKVKT